MDQDDLNKNTTALPDPASSGLSGLPPLPALDTAEDDTFSPPPAPPQPLPPVKVSPEPTPISHSGDESARTPESQQTDSGQAPAERDSGRMTKKKFSKKTIIGGIIALVLLVAVPLVALNLDKFSGDIRQRAAPPTEKSQCVGCADKNHEWEWTNGKCKKKYKKDCQGGGGGSDSCAGSLSASTCKTVSVGDRCVGFNGTCKRTTDDNCACVPDPTATPGPTPYCSRTCTGNFYCQPDLNGGTCVIDIPTPIPTAIINECENAGGACFYTPSCQKINKQTVNGGNGCSDIGGGEICCGGIVVPPDSCLTAGETCGPYVDPKCCSDLECNDFFNGYGVCKSSGSDQECENAGGACFYTPSCQKINKQTVNGGNGCSDIGGGEICCGGIGGSSSSSSSSSSGGNVLCPYDCVTSRLMCTGINLGVSYGDCGISEYCCETGGGGSSSGGGTIDCGTQTCDADTEVCCFNGCKPIEEGCEGGGSSSSSSGGGRPDYCVSASITPTTLASGETAQVSSASNTAVKVFSYAFFNMDNLYGPGNPKPICVSGTDGWQGGCPDGTHHLILADILSTATKTNTKSFTFEDVFVNDMHSDWDGSQVERIQINAYFADEVGAPTSLADPDCVTYITKKAESGVCVETRIYTLQAGTWTITALSQVGQYAGVGDKVRLAVSGNGASFSQGRFRVNAGSWTTTTTKNSAGEFYIEYTLSQAGTYNIEGQVQ